MGLLCFSRGLFSLELRADLSSHTNAKQHTNGFDTRVKIFVLAHQSTGRMVSWLRSIEVGQKSFNNCTSFLASQGLYRTTAVRYLLTGI